MVEYTRYLGQLLIGWRVALLALVAVDYFGQSEAGFSIFNNLQPWLAVLKPTGAFIGVCCLTFVSIGLSVTLGSRERAIPVAFADVLCAIMATVGMPKSIAATLLFTLPVLDLSVLGPVVGIVAGFVLMAVYPGLLVARGGQVMELREVSWYIGFMFLAMITAFVAHTQQRQEAQTEAVVSVIQTSQELGTSASLDRILSVAVRDIKQLFDCTGCVVYLRDLKDSNSTFMTVAEADTLNRESFIDFDREQKKSAIGEVMEARKALLITDFQSYTDEEAIRHATHIRSTMVAPLLFENEALGALFVSHHAPGFYQLGALRLFTLLANQLGVAVRNVQLQKTTEEMAITDSLSGLYTHGYFQGNLDQLIEDAKHRTQQPLSLAILDIDFFKRVNDTYGHPQGDALLKQLGSILKRNARAGDTVCRYGGDEFVLTMPNTTHAEAAMLTERIRQATEEYDFALGRKVVHVTVSGGVATFPEDADTKLELIARADAAMYRAKQRGRNRVVRRGSGGVLFQTVGVDENEETVKDASS